MVDSDKVFRDEKRSHPEDDRYFAQIDFGVPKKKEPIQVDRDPGPCYNPLTWKFYKQKLVWYDPDWGWMIQGDLIIFWFVFIGVCIVSFL